jgi:hypothetical protein
MDHHEFLKELEHAGFVDVEISPQTLDENLVADFLGADVVELCDSVEQKPKININGEWVSLDLGDRKLPFSARITARKP